MENKVYSLKKTARLAGLLYFFLIITGVYIIMYVPSQIIVWGDADTTAKNILSNEFLFRTGIIGDIISNTIFVFLVLVPIQIVQTGKRTSGYTYGCICDCANSSRFYYGGIQYYFPYDF